MTHYSRCWSAKTACTTGDRTPGVERDGTVPRTFFPWHSSPLPSGLALALSLECGIFPGMGIYSRDYVRESPGSAGGFSGETPACKWLILITVIVFVLQVVVTHESSQPERRAFGMRESYVNDWGALSLTDMKTGQVWRLVTYAFLHARADLWHLLFNMLGLWWFGAEMERLYGSKEFSFFYLAAAVAAGAGYVLWQLATLQAGERAPPVVGASGAVLAAMTLYATHYPREKIGLFYGLIFIEVRWVVALYAAMDLLPVLQSLQGERVLTGVAHAAHLLGIAFGLLYRHYRWHLSSLINLSAIGNLSRRWRQRRVRQTLKVYEPEPDVNLDVEVDRILAKIHEQGSSSLTEREQAILTKASQQYKNRK